MQLHYPLNPATGLEDPTQLPWTNGVPSTGTEGSYPPFALCTEPQAEIVNAIQAAGLTPASADPFQLLRSIRGGQLTTFTDTGTANVMAITSTGTAHLAIAKGLPFRVWPLNTNTSTTVTLKVDALPATSVKKRDGTNPAIGDIVAGVPIDVVGDAAGNLRVLGFLASDILALIAANKIGIQNPLPPVTTPGTYTYTASSPTVRAILVKGQAPGGGGSASSNTSSSQASVGVPGGGGGYFEHYMTSGFSGASYTVGAPGAGGTVVSGVGQAGFSGGTTSFAGGPTAQGGFGGAQTYPVTVPAYSNTAAVSGGVVSGGNLVNRPGGASQASQYLGSTAYGGQGGSSQNGSSGLALATTGPGSSGAGFGAGGTPGVTEPNAASQLGGAGGGGFIQITEIF